MKRFIFILAAIAFCGLVVADDDCCMCKCDHCGCKAHCHRVCHVICEMKEVKDTCYSCKCEDFCIPGRSTKCGEVCECDPCKHQWCWFDCLTGHHSCESYRNVWEPSCDAEIRSRNKLYKREISKKVPTYRWVVEYRCDDCCQKCAADEHKLSAKHELAAVDREAPAAALPPPCELKMATLCGATTASDQNEPQAAATK